MGTGYIYNLSGCGVVDGGQDYTYTVVLGEQEMKHKKQETAKKLTLEDRVKAVESLTRDAHRRIDCIHQEKSRQREARQERLDRWGMAIIHAIFIITAFWVGRASAEPLCPFGCENLKPQTPASCFESFSKPECENTKIDPGNDREEWKYLSEGYPQQVIALGNFEQSAWEEVEFQMARKRYWRFRALRCERGE